MSRPRGLTSGDFRAPLVALMWVTSLAACEKLPVGRVVPWEEAAPQTVGLNRSKLDVLKEALAARQTAALLVVRHGRIAYEWYAAGHGPWRREATASLSKSLVGGMALLVALSDARLRLEDPASTYIPAWRDDPLKSKITVRHLATHTSGLEHGRGAEPDGWSEVFWQRKPQLFEVVLAETPVAFDPGTQFLYSGPAFAVLSYVVTAAIQMGPETDIQALLQRRVMEPLGVPGSAWQIGYGRSYELNGLELYASWGGGEYTARAVARVGQLMLQKGRWGDEQLVDPIWVDQMVSQADTPLPRPSERGMQPVPAACWWSNANRSWPDVPPDAFAGAGAGGQLLLVIPSLDLVAVRLGGALGTSSWGLGLWQDLNEVFFSPLMHAVVDAR